MSMTLESQGAVVHVRADRPACKSKISDSGAANIISLANAYKDLEDRLFGIFLTMHKVGTSVSPWGLKKNKIRVNDAANEIKSQIPVIKSVFANSLSLTKKQIEEAQMLSRQLGERNEKCYKLFAQNEELKAKQTQLEEELHLEGNQKDELAAELEAFRLQVAALEEEKEALSCSVQELKQFKEESTKRQAAASKASRASEVSSGEVARLKAEVKRLSRIETIRTSRDQTATNLASRTAELRLAQQRYDTLMSDYRELQDEHRTTVASLDEANTLLGMNQEETQGLARRLAMAQREKEQLAKQLKSAQMKMSPEADKNSDEYLMAWNSPNKSTL